MLNFNEFIVNSINKGEVKSSESFKIVPTWRLYQPFDRFWLQFVQLRFWFQCWIVHSFINIRRVFFCIFTKNSILKWIHALIWVMPNRVRRPDDPIFIYNFAISAILKIYMFVYDVFINVRISCRHFVSVESLLFE